MGFNRNPFAKRQRSHHMATRNQFSPSRQGTPYGQRSETGRIEGRAGRGESGMERHEGQGRGEETGGNQEEMGVVGGIATRHPYTTVLTSFGIGFGFGLFVTLHLTRPGDS